MSQLSVLVCGTISVWCLVFMIRLPLVQNLGPYGNGVALLETLYPVQFHPSLEIAHSCYRLTVASQSENGEIKGVPQVLAIKAQALVIRVRYVWFSAPFLISSTNENTNFTCVNFRNMIGNTMRFQDTARTIGSNLHLVIFRSHPVAEVDVDGLHRGVTESI
ncbi:hypothetical protein BD769DRAFT_1019518 [Suillus cothurnatus]|nr:hypothetical protein BD769DRAFT_1019518 [Suillus cothurnatus]